MRKFVALFDIHCGFEMRGIGQKRVKTMTHDPKTLNAVLKFVSDFQPDTLILGGDQLENGAISKHNFGKPRLVEGLRITDDMNELDKHVLSRVDGMKFLKNKIWIIGNHENRIGRFLDINPAAEGIIEPEKYLSLNKRGWTVWPEEEPYRIGKLNFIHGHSLFSSGGGENPARRLVQAYRRSIRCGHLHTFSAYTDVTPADRRDYHTGIVVPALCVSGPDYLKNRPTNFQQGFLYGYVAPSGDFNDFVVNIHESKFITEVTGLVRG